MYRSFRAIFVFLAPAIAAHSAPFIPSHSIRNAASYYAVGLPAGAIAQGSMFTVFGSGIGPTTAMQQTSFPLQTTLGGVSIQVTQSTTTVSAIPLFVLQGQVNALMPSNAPLGRLGLAAHQLQ